MNRLKDVKATMKNKLLLAITAFTAVMSYAMADIISIDGVRVTSVVQLLTHPERYEGRRVQVKGYYFSGREFSAIFVSRESAELKDIESGIWLDLPSDPEKGTNIATVTQGYVTVIGKFHYIPDGGVGHLDAWPGAIDNVSLFVPARRIHLSDEDRQYYPVAPGGGR